MLEARPLGVEEKTWRWLGGRLWHVTTSCRWDGIYSERVIRADLPDAPYQRGLCRLFGAISLFDMSGAAEGIEEAAKDWMPWLSGDGEPVRLWIEVDRDAVAERFITPEDLRCRFRLNMETRDFWPCPKYIQNVEAGHSGSIPLDALRGVMLTDGPNRFEWCGVIEGVAEAAARFASAAPPDLGIAARMEAARLARRSVGG